MSVSEMGADNNIGENLPQAVDGSALCSGGAWVVKPDINCPVCGTPPDGPCEFSPIDEEPI